LPRHFPYTTLFRSVSPRRRFPLVLGIACVVLGTAVGFFGSRAFADPVEQAASSGGDRPVIGIEHTGPIRVVFQVSADETQDGLGKGLVYLKKLHEGYVRSGVEPNRLDIRAVFHGKAADHTLTDEAWNRYRQETGGNPNTALLDELAE